MKYFVWKLEFNEDDIQMIEVLDVKDLLKVQNEFVNKGFIIDEVFNVKSEYYIKVSKFKS